MFPPPRVPRIVKGVLPGMLWSMPVAESKDIYLTFDDGPIPEITPWVLKTLKEYNAKATFFCVGDNALKYPEILELIRKDGHVVGNHTNNHLNGWKTPDKEYFRNVIEADETLNSPLFRPPYGKLKPSQLKQLRKKYQIVMWSVLTMDYDAKVSEESCLKNSLVTGAGDIVLFHDSIKAQKNLSYALPRFLRFYSENGFQFLPLSVN